MPGDLIAALILSGLVLMIIGFIIIAMQGQSFRGGAVLMIGPVPIIAGNDRRILLVLMLLAVALMLIWVLIQL